MALFTDGMVNSVEQLMAYDSGVLETARTEEIELTIKLKLAWEELGIDLKRYFVERGKGELRLEQVVVTEPLRKCHAFRSLALAYRDAAHRQRNDRYRERWWEWEKRAAWAWEALLETGVGVVERPIPRASSPRVDLAPGPTPAATYCVQTTWVNAVGEEGAPSEEVLVSAASGEGLVVVPREVPEGVVGWNVYVGYAGAGARRQNSALLEPGQRWVQAGVILTEGRQPGDGQSPDYYLRRAPMPGDSRGGSWFDTPGFLWRG